MSCSAGGIKTETSEYEQEGKYARITLPVFENEGFDTEIRKTTDEILNNFLLYNEKARLELDTDVKANGERIKSVVIDGTCEKGDNTPERIRIAKTMDFQEGRFLELSDFLTDGWEQKADNIMKELSESDEYDELWEMPTVAQMDKENFYIEDGKIVLFYPPYKLSYYSRGFVEFSIDMEDMRGYLTDLAKNGI